MTTTTSIEITKAPASEFAPGDTFGTTRKEAASGDFTVGAITEGPGGRVQLRDAAHKMIKSAEPQVNYWRGRTVSNPNPNTPTEDSDMSTPTSTDTPKPTETPATETAAPISPWAEDGGRALVIEYLTENVSAEADAPNRGLPFITETGVLRIRAEHWRGWLTARGIEVGKVESSRPIREQLGYSMKPFAIPGEQFSYGFYTGPVPTEAAELPKRIVARKSAGTGTSKARTPRNPFAKLTSEQRAILRAGLTSVSQRAMKEIGGDAKETAAAMLAQLVAADADADTLATTPPADAPADAPASDAPASA